MKHFVGCLLLSLFSTVCTAQRFPVDTLQKTGPLNRRINVVILGDGFTQSELPAFAQAAKNFVAFFSNYPPYDAYRNYFNFFAIPTPSNESGATNLGAAPDRYPSQPIETKDTYYGSSFGTSNIHRLVAINKRQAFTNVMATNFPSYDLAIMIVNSPWYGGSGGNPATFTLQTQANLIGIHEIGHTFSSLIDEYWAGTVYAREGANMTGNNNPATVSWKNWVGQFNVGIYPHTGAADAGNWYKPTVRNCLMEQLDKPFCTVCREATTDRILQFVKPVETVQPLPESRVIVSNKPELFKLTLLKPNPNTLRIEWRLNDIVLNRDSAQVAVSPDQLTNATNTLSVSVLDTTAYIRSESHRRQRTYTYRWTLEKSVREPIFAITASKNSVCLGESVTLTATNCAKSIAWSTGETNTTITISPTQPITYSATCGDTGGLPQTVSFNVVVLPAPVVGVANTGPYYAGQTVKLMAQGGVSYSWSGPLNFVSSEQNPTISAATVSQTGAYTVAVTGANQCVSRSETVVSINVPLAVTPSLTDAIRVFPNPVQGSVQIQTALPGELSITLLDGAGRTVLRKAFYRATEFSTEKLLKTMYLYRISNGQQTITGKLLVE